MRYREPHAKTMDYNGRYDSTKGRRMTVLSALLKSIPNHLALSRCECKYVCACVCSHKGCPEERMSAHNPQPLTHLCITLTSIDRLSDQGCRCSTIERDVLLVCWPYFCVCSFYFVHLLLRFENFVLILILLCNFQ